MGYQFKGEKEELDIHIENQILNSIQKRIADYDKKLEGLEVKHQLERLAKEIGDKRREFIKEKNELEVIKKIEREE